MSRRLQTVLWMILMVLVLSPAGVRGEESVSLAEKVAGLQKMEGLLPVYLDRARGRVWLELPPAPAGEEGWSYIYMEGLTAGLGSNPVGLDRSQQGESQLVVLRRVGGRVLVEQQNLRFRALTANVDEQRAVRESFATSVLWAGEVAAEEPDGTVLVDFTSFLVRDAHGAVATLDRTGQGSYSLDRDRSVVDPDAVHAFPDNLEFEAVLTYSGSKPGPQVRATAPTPTAVTLRQHHSLIRLPDDGYQPRVYDPRAGSFAVDFQDYAAPLDAPLMKRWIVRHRLQAGDTITYYVDRGVPEPVRSALVDGAEWWADAFAAAGFPDSFKVELLPEGAHPLDVRYNVIQWVHRATRGWSYGGGIVDPRTGEMIKGHVLLGSLRVRQDRILFEGLAGTASTGGGGPNDPVQLALARIRQLSAHEVGHTLGLAHNFAASTYGRASVMDYPAPLVQVTADGGLDFSQAYAIGAGSWDIFAIRYAHTDFGGDPGDEAAGLRGLIQEALAGNLLFLTDPDARPAGAAEPRANLWDNGPDPVAALEVSLAVRRIALDRFAADRVLSGQPLAYLQEVLAPVYFHHRFQLDAAAKVVGGLNYTYAIRDDGQSPARMIDPAQQRRALAVLTGLLDPAALDLREDVLNLLTPRPGPFGGNRELFNGDSGPVFDPMAAAASAARQVVDALLQPQRATRLVDFHRRDASQPGLREVLDLLESRVTLVVADESPRHSALRRVAAWQVVDGMLALALNHDAPPQVRARVVASLNRVQRDLTMNPGESEDEKDHRVLMAAAIKRFSQRPAPAMAMVHPAAPLPPGSPIGAAADSGHDAGCGFRH